MNKWLKEATCIKSCIKLFVYICIKLNRSRPCRLWQDFGIEGKALLTSLTRRLFKDCSYTSRSCFKHLAFTTDFSHDLFFYSQSCKLCELPRPLHWQSGPDIGVNPGWCGSQREKERERGRVSAGGLVMFVWEESVLRFHGNQPLCLSRRQPSKWGGSFNFKRQSKM